MSGQKHQTRNRRTGIAENIFLLVVAAVLLATGLYWSLVYLAGTPAAASVVTRSPFPASSGDGLFRPLLYSVQYRFATDTSVFAGYGVSAGWAGQPGQTVPIRYLASRPGLNLMMAGQPWMTLIWLAVGLLLLAGNIFLIQRKRSAARPAVRQAALSPGQNRDAG